MAKKKKKAPQPALPWLKYSWWAIPLLAVLVYIPSFNAGFTLDDVPIIEENIFIRTPGKLAEIWTSDYWAGKIDATDRGLYRPLTLTTYAIQYWMHGQNPVPFHIFNILLHALICFVLMRYLFLLFKDQYLTALAGLFFAVHPIHTEAVSGIVGRAELLTGLFILCAGISYHHWRLKGGFFWLSAIILSTIAAITSKEHGYMVPAILVLQEFLYSRPPKKEKIQVRIWSGISAILLVTMIFWGIRNAVTGPPARHEQWLHVDAPDRMATAVRTTMEYIGLHIFPLKLTADYWSDIVPVAGWGDPVVYLALLVSLTLILTAFWKFRIWNGYGWGILFFFLMLAPVSNFFFAAGFLKAERILYIPSMGLITAMAALLILLFNKRQFRFLSFGFIVLFVAFFAIRTWVRAGDWKNNYTLAQATLKVSPNSPRFNNMMGLELREQERNNEALVFFEKAVQSNPNHVPALVNLGTEYKNFKRLPEAAQTLERALRTDSSTMMAYVNLMSVYRDMGDYDRNVRIAELALRRYPNSAPVLWNAANAYQLKNNMAKANELRARSKEIDPGLMK